MNGLFAAVCIVSMAIATLAQDIAEPKTGEKFAASDGDLAIRAAHSWFSA